MLSVSAASLLSAHANATAAAEPRAAEATFDAVRERIRNAIAAKDATGVAVAVIQHGQIVWTEGFGWANREAGVRVTPHTPFGMASLTKPFTTTTVMTLVQEGKCTLDGAANNALRGNKLLGVNGRAEKVTVRMLGAHVSGLPGMYESYSDAEQSLVPSADALLGRYGRLAYVPGSVYEYSNIGYAALNSIAFSLTSKEFGSLMDQRVLAPLGLKDSFFSSVRERVPSAAIRYDPLGRAIPHYVTSTPASGELYASAHDLARFLLFNMGQHPDREVPVLTGPNLREMHRPAFTGPSGVASTFGWFAGHTPSGVPFLFKTGGDPGVANRMCFVPSKGLACVALTNQSNSGTLAYSICDEIMRLELPDWQQPKEYCGYARAPLDAAGRFGGNWRGLLENDGVRAPLRLEVKSAQAATLAIGSGNAEAITEMQTEGEALVGASVGHIRSPDALRTGARKLLIKLLADGDRLRGRIFATEGDPNFRNATLPFVVTLERS